MFKKKTSEPQTNEPKEINLDLIWNAPPPLIPYILTFLDDVHKATENAVDQMIGPGKDKTSEEYGDAFREALIHVIAMYSQELRKDLIDNADLRRDCIEVQKVLVDWATKKMGQTADPDNDSTEGETYVPRENYSDVMFG